MEASVIVMGDKLPTIYDGVMALLDGNREIKIDSADNKKRLGQVAAAIHTQFLRVFPENDVKTVPGIRYILQREYMQYKNQVCFIKHVQKRSKFLQYKREKNNIFPALKNLDISEAVRSFYEDQCGSRTMHITDLLFDVDEESDTDEMDISAEDSAGSSTDQTDESEEDVAGFPDQEYEEDSETDLSSDDDSEEFMYLRSGQKFNRTEKNDSNDEPKSSKKTLRTGTKYFTNECLKSIVQVTTAVGVTVMQARKCFQIIEHEFNGENFVLKLSEKVPKGAGSYQMYENVIPSENTIWYRRHQYALGEEMRCATAILNTSENLTVSIAFDTTTRKGLAYEWSSFIVHISNGQKFRLRPLALYRETKENIVNIFVEQMNRLAIASEKDAIQIWAKVTAIMTDSVSKNLQIAEGVAESLSSNHVPLQILCTAHSCERFEKDELQCLLEEENKQGLREKLIEKMPELKKFLSNKKKAVTHSAIEALSKLARDDGANSNMSMAFDEECKRSGTKRKVGFSSLKERRFTVLGYTAGCINHHLNEYKGMLSKTTRNNDLIRACKLYLGEPFLIEAFSALAIFTEKIILPFLVTVQSQNTTQLIDLFGTLYKDLSKGDINTFQNYQSFNLKLPQDTLFVRTLLSKFAKGCATGLVVQRGREFGFGNEGNERATNLTKILPSIRDQLPTHNLDCERDLAHMDRIIKRSSISYNRNSTYKGLRDEMVLYPVDEFDEILTFLKGKIKIIKELDKREAVWNEKQERILDEKRAEEQQLFEKNKQKWIELIGICRSWNGPFETLEQMEESLNGIDEKSAIKMLRTEIILHRRCNFITGLDYRVNSRTKEELFDTLTKILKYEVENPMLDQILPQI